MTLNASGPTPAADAEGEARGFDQLGGDHPQHNATTGSAQAPELRPYQTEVVERVERILGMASRPLIVAPTGSGKTIIAAEIINRVVGRGGRVLMIAHRREMITQTRDKLV